MQTGDWGRQEKDIDQFRAVKNKGLRLQVTITYNVLVFNRLDK